MTSTYTPLGVELMVTGENAGTWGTKTNTNLNLIEQISGGYVTQAIAGSGTDSPSTFAKADGALGAVVASRVIVFTGALTGSRIITFPVLTENFYIIKNATTNAQTLQLKAASGSGATVTWATGDKGWKIVYFDGVATNTGVYDTGFGVGDVTLTGTQTLTNKTLTSPKIGTNILDVNGLELLNLTATGSAVNELTLANAATGNSPIISATGEANVGITLTPKGSGAVKLDLLTFPTVTGTANQIMTSNGSGVLSFVDNSGGTDWQAVKTGTYTAVAGEGVFANTTSGAWTLTLPSSPTIGDEVSVIDYAGTFDTNNLTIGRNSQKIQGAAADLTVATERAGFTLAFTDGTQGWLLKNN